MRDLEGAQQALVEQLMRGQTGDVLAIHRHAPRGWFKNARDHIEKSGFSGAIGADQPGDRCLLDASVSRHQRHESRQNACDKIFNDDHRHIPLRAGLPPRLVLRNGAGDCSGPFRIMIRSISGS